MNALQTTMGLRAEKLRLSEIEYIDATGEPLTIACVEAVHKSVQGLDRLVALAQPPLREAVAPWQRLEMARLGATSPVPLVVALPQGQQGFLVALAHATGDIIDVNRSREILGCRASGVAAIECAIALLSGDCEAVLVGGVDSYFDVDRLDALADTYRLHTLVAENGFIVGEAAAFLLLVHRHRASGLTRYASVLGHAMEMEPRPFGSKDPCHALGMTAAIRRAAAPVGLDQIAWQLTDVVNERHRVEEWLLAHTRTFRIFTKDYVHEQPLLTVGDVGAASAALFAVEASVRWQTGCGISDLVMLALHSDGPERGAVLLARESQAAQS
jgi:3-oxoacyl-[acyl-carrier-protein] synthase-1